MKTSCRVACTFVILLAVAPFAAIAAQQANVSEIVQRSVEANEADFKVAPDFNYKERDRMAKGSKTYQVTMIDGSPYQRLIAVDGEPLSPSQAAAEEKKQQQAAEQRRSQSSEERQNRIQKYEKERRRDHAMMAQLTKAFDFTLVGHRKVRGFNVYVLKATPKPGYQPPNMETQVLPGMQGELWIDQQTYQWVKVTAHVVRPVSIEGFLAQVQPGTQFELEKSPVESGGWQPTHFAMKSNAKVFYMFSHASQEDDTFFDYQPVGSSGSGSSGR